MQLAKMERKVSAVFLLVNSIDRHVNGKIFLRAVWQYK